MGAIGQPKPSSPLSASSNVSSLLGAQYLGFIYGDGVSSGNLTEAPIGWTSHVASFGFAGYPTLPSACYTFAAQTGTLVNGLYDGDFPQNNGQDDPSASPDGFGNCDFAIALGTEDPLNNGLFPNAKVWMESNYVANSSKTFYSFSAVAIAGQLNGQYAIFILGVDSTQPWAIYLLQSN